MEINLEWRSASHHFKGGYKNKIGTKAELTYSPVLPVPVFCFSFNCWIKKIISICPCSLRKNPLTFVLLLYLIWLTNAQCRSKIQTCSVSGEGEWTIRLPKISDQSSKSTEENKFAYRAASIFYPSTQQSLQFFYECYKATSKPNLKPIQPTVFTLFQL